MVLNTHRKRINHLFTLLVEKSKNTPLFGGRATTIHFLQHREIIGNRTLTGKNSKN